MVKVRRVKGKFAGAYLTGSEYVLLVVRHNRRKVNRNIGEHEFDIPPLTKGLKKFQRRFHGTFRYDPRWEICHFVRLVWRDAKGRPHIKVRP